MGTRRLVLVTGLACLVEALVLVWFPVFGVRPRLLPPLAALVGTEHGPERGAACGLLGGVFSTLTGASPFQMALLALVGGISGVLFHKAASFWGKWLACLGILTGMEVLLALGHGLAGASLLAALGLAGRELLPSAACFPLAFLLTRQGGGGAAGGGGGFGRWGRLCRDGRWSRLDRRRLEPARWFPARPRAGAPISCEEMGRKKPRGIPPGPPFLMARSFALARFGGCATLFRSMGYYGAHVRALIWGLFFAKCFFSIFFLENASQIGLSIPEEIAPRPYQRQRPQKPASGNERP